MGRDEGSTLRSRHPGAVKGLTRLRVFTATSTRNMLRETPAASSSRGPSLPLMTTSMRGRPALESGDARTEGQGAGLSCAAPLPSGAGTAVRHPRNTQGGILAENEAEPEDPRGQSHSILRKTAKDT